MTYASSDPDSPGFAERDSSVEMPDWHNSFLIPVDDATSLRQIEARLASQSQANLRNRSVQMEINLGSGRPLSVLQEMWTALVVETLARAGTNVRVHLQDIKSWDRYEDWKHLLSETNLLKICLFHLAAHYPRLQICAQNSDVLPPQIPSNIRHRIRNNDGISEYEHQWEKSITIWCLDPEFRTPKYLSTCVEDNDSEKFNFYFSRLRSYLEPEVMSRFRSKNFEADSPTKNLNTYVFELYKNTFHHGQLDINGEKKPGFRFLQLKKIDLSEAAQLRAAGSLFPQLADSLDRIKLPGNKRLFLQITICDSGLGLVDGASILRPDIPICQREDIDERRRRLQIVLRQRFTRKLGGDKRDGWGIKDALRSLQYLAGTVSLRSDRFWLVKKFDYAENQLESSDPAFVPELEEIPADFAVQQHRAFLGGCLWPFWLPMPS